MTFDNATIRRVLIDCKLLGIFQMTPDEVCYALWSAMFWAAPLGEDEE